MNLDEVVGEIIEGCGGCVVRQFAAEPIRQACVAPHAHTMEGHFVDDQALKARIELARSEGWPAVGNGWRAKTMIPIPDHLHGGRAFLARYSPKVG
jgi:hypothetical protein